MRVGVFVTTFCAYETVLGVSNTAFLIAKKLAEDYGSEIFVHAPLEELLGQKKSEDFKNFHVRRFKTIGPKGLSIFRTGSIREKFDVVHSYHYGYFPASAGFRYARKTGAPHFMTTAYHPHQLSRMRKALFSLYNNIEGKKILKNSSAVTPFNKNEMQQLRSISDGNYTAIPSPINTDIFHPRRKKNKQMVIGYVGNLLPWKGARIAFDICKEIERLGYDVSFVFIGRGVLEEELKRETGKNFIFLKDLSIERLAEWYNKIDILIYPSFYESFGRVLAEAITCGCAVVSTSVGAIPETVGPGGVLVEYGQWGKMKEAVIKLIEIKSFRHRCSKAGIKHAENFDYNTVAKKVFDLYTKHSENRL